MSPVQSRFHMLLDAFRVSGKDLAALLHIDSSLVSKWKNNKRSMKSNSTYLNNIVEYFVSMDSISNYSIIKALLERDYETVDYTSPQELSIALKHWLIRGDHTDEVDTVLYDCMHRNKKGREHSYLLFHGNAGRREAVKNMLQIANMLPPGQEIWSYSQDSPSWFMEDEEFIQQWADWNMEFLRKGNVIHVIHPVDRQYKSLAISLLKWLPLHMTGLTKPYYLPQYWESDTKNTYFLVKDKLFLSSVSVESVTKEVNTLVFTDPRVLKDNYDMLKSHFQSATPLFTKYGLKDNKKFTEDLTNMANKNEQQYIFTSLPFVNVLTHDEIAQILRNNDVPSQTTNECLKACEILQRDAQDNGGNFFRYLVLPSQLARLLRQPTIPLDTLSFFSGKVLHINNQAFRALLAKTADKLKKDPYYEVGLAEDSLVSHMEGLNMFVKRNTSACIFTLQENDLDPLILMTHESVVIISLFLCCDQIWNTMLPRNRNKEYVTDQIHTLVKTVFP